MCRAIISSSFVRSTKTRTRERSEEMTSSLVRLRARSISTPIHSIDASVASRIRCEFSPIPPQNTIASSPSSTAVIAPISRRMRNTKYSTASTARGSPDASRSRMSLEMPDRPFSPDSI